MMARWYDGIVDDKGQFPAYAWPGGYPIVYVTTDGDTVCAGCLNKRDKTGFRLENAAGDYDSDGFHVVGFDVHYEGPPETCCECSVEIPSAYGDPDAEGE